MDQLLAPLNLFVYVPLLRGSTTLSFNLVYNTEYTNSSIPGRAYATHLESKVLS